MGATGFTRGLMTLSLTFIALMGIYALWADEITAAYWKTFLSFGILLLLSLAIQTLGKSQRTTGDPSDSPLQ
ncbi:MAG: hypothetical protein AAFR41_03460 [Pseudomonadota bacterium]